MHKLGFHFVSEFFKEFSHPYEYFVEFSAFLMADNPHVILFVHPHKKVSYSIVKDSPPDRPTVGPIGGLHESIRLLEQKVVAQEMLVRLSGHGLETVVRARVVAAAQLLQGHPHFRFRSCVVVGRHSRVHRIAGERSGYADTDRHHVLPQGVEIAQTLK